MEADRFDRLARALHAGGSRRVALQILTGGAIAGAAALLGDDEAAAGCPRSRRCGKGNCCPKGQLCGDKASKTCVTGQGTCAAGEDFCAGVGFGDCASTVGSPESCRCYTSIHGKTRCGSQFFLNGGGCGTPCSKDAECRALFPNVPGAFCVKTAGCCANGNACAAPCAA
jgi:hypothetical protein